MQLQQASRQQTKIRLGIQGPAGSGKSFGALQIASGLTSDWSKIAVIDTEFGSACLYSDLGHFNVVRLSPPFSPEKYSEAIRLCESAEIEVIILDSISHEWEGTGGVLDIHNSLSGNSFTNWGKVTPRHNRFVQSILQSQCHIIATIRSKQDYVLTDKNGKTVPEKVGLKGVQRDGIEYEFTSLFEIDIKHNVTATKDRTSLFSGTPEFKLTPEIGSKFLAWCNQGAESSPDERMRSRIEAVASIAELLELYKNSPVHQEALHELFTRKRKELELNQADPELLYQKNQTGNGKYNVN